MTIVSKFQSVNSQLFGLIFSFIDTPLIRTQTSAHAYGVSAPQAGRYLIRVSNKSESAISILSHF